LTAVCRGRVTAAWNVYATLDDVLAAVRASPHEAPTLIDLAPQFRDARCGGGLHEMRIKRRTGKKRGLPLGVNYNLDFQLRKNFQYLHYQPYVGYG